MKFPCLRLVQRQLISKFAFALDAPLPDSGATPVEALWSSIDKSFAKEEGCVAVTYERK
jgi:hypothetical protein